VTGRVPAGEKRFEPDRGEDHDRDFRRDSKADEPVERGGVEGDERPEHGPSRQRRPLGSSLGFVEIRHLERLVDAPESADTRRRDEGELGEVVAHVVEASVAVPRRGDGRLTTRRRT
jgi:hypothetical protein